jgi:hypothetical protein
MPYDPKHPLLDWYRYSGVRRANKPTDEDGAIWQPDFTDPPYLKFWGELVAAAGKRYDGMPDLDTVDIPSIGYWGEGWSPYMPPFPYQKAAIEIWLDSVKRTPLLMNFDEQQALTYGTEHGAGGLRRKLRKSKPPPTHARFAAGRRATRGRFPVRCRLAGSGFRATWFRHIQPAARP